MFSTKTYQERRNTLKEKMSDGLLIFLGNIENPINFEDNPYPFRQDSSFLYYFGIQEPNLAAAIDLDNDETILFGDELNIDEIVWMGTQETIKAKGEKSGVQKTRPYKDFYKLVSQAKNKGKKIHFLPPYQSVNKIVLSKLLNTSIENLQPSVAFIKAIAAQRAIKETQEIEEIEQSVNLTNEMHLLAMRKAKPGLKEYELVSTLQKLAADHESTFAYPPIVTVDGQTLHNHYRGNTLQSGDMVLNDSGTENPMGYAADLTRTFPVDTTFTNKQKEIYQIVHKAFLEAQKILKPNTDFKDVHLKTVQTLTEGLTDIGLMKGNPEEAVRNNAHTLFMPTGVGHYMGLDVHDMEDLGEQYVGYTEDDPKDQETFGWKSLRLGKALKKGNVVTVEPGFYVIPQLVDMWKADNKNAEFINYKKLEEYRDFSGIRIEDDYLITQDGYRLLGDGLIHKAEDIEAYRKEHA